MDEVTILAAHDGTFEIWANGELVRDGFASKIDAAYWANENNYKII